MKNIIGDRFICIDLDTIITGNIDHILSRKEDFVYYRFPYPNGKNRFNCCMYMMDSGSRSNIWKIFNENPNHTMKLSSALHEGTDQSVCNTYLDLSREAYWDINDGIYDMREHFIEKNIKSLPENCCMVMWPGPRDPSMEHYKNSFDWIREYYI